MILVTDGLETARETLSHLRAQTAAGRIELVLTMPDGEAAENGERALAGFHSTRVVPSDPQNGTAVARAAAIVQARAPVVVLAETHCFPEPEWADMLIAAHREPWAAVGPEIDNDNPDKASSWGNLLVDYSPWLAPATRGPTNDLPGHNSSYKRALLLDYGDDLPRLLESETILHWDLRGRGHQLYVETRARTRHRNITRPVPSLFEHFHNGRTFGALRSRDWHPARRIFYAAASPLIPILRLGRILREIRRTKRRELLPDVLPTVLGALIAHGVGEFTGYLLGSGRSTEEMAKYEIYRDRYVAEISASTQVVHAAEPGKRG